MMSDVSSSHPSAEDTSNGPHPEWAAFSDNVQQQTTAASAVQQDPPSSSTLSGKEFTEIDRAYLLVGKHKREHVCSLLGPSMQRNEDAIANLMAKLDLLKKELRDWASGEIRARMLAEALKHKLPVRHFGEIKQWWSKNSTEKDQKIVARIAYGIWDEQPGWEFALEETYMQLKKWKYKENVDATTSPHEINDFETKGIPSQPKGFVSRLITNVKGDQVKQLQDAGKNGHGINITISRATGQISKENKWKKRKKGTFRVTKTETKPSRKKKAKKPSGAVSEGHYMLALSVHQFTHCALCFRSLFLYFSN